LKNTSNKQKDQKRIDRNFVQLTETNMKTVSIS